MFAVADGWYEVGEVRRRRGDLDGRRGGLRARRHEIGRDPQPGLALLRLARGPGRRGVGVDRRRPRRVRRQRPERAPLLCRPGRRSPSSPATSTWPRQAAAEVPRRGDPLDSTGLRAAGAPVHRAPWRWPGARPSPRSRALRAGSIAWQELDAPYEGARTPGARRRGLRPAGRPRRRRPRAGRRPRLLRAAGRGRPSSGASSVAGARRRPDTHGLTARELEVLHAGGHRPEQPRDRRRPGHQREDRGPAPRQHLREARRAVPVGRHGLRVRQRPRSRRTDPSAQNHHMRRGTGRCTRRPMCAPARRYSYVPPTNHHSYRRTRQCPSS